MVRGHGGWPPLPYSRQAKGGDEGRCLPPLPGPGPHGPPHGLGFRHVLEYMSRRGSAYADATGLPFPRPIPTWDTFTDTWKELVTRLHLRPPVSIPDPPASGRSWPLPSWAWYVQSRPSLVDTIDWTRPLTFIVCGDAYPCASGSWIQLSIGLLNHGARGRTPAYLWVIVMAVCRDKDMAALATIWADNLKVCGPFIVC